MGFEIKKIGSDERGFPGLLKEMAGAPMSLFYIGNLPLENQPAIAIVGTRKSTREGLLIAQNMASELSNRGFAIISGLALGIDGAAHKGTLEAGGKTFAVLGSGLHEIYPTSHQNLAHEIIKKGGGIISEYPEGSPSLPHQFLERNRIIAGLSLATIVIEAPTRSGALVTARHAIEAGREVFVVPGSVRNKNYDGAHMLIRNGARLVRNSGDVLEDLGYEMGTSADESLIFQSDDERMVFNAIQNLPDGGNVDILVEITNLEPHVVLQTITMLSLSGKVREVGGKFVIV